MLHHYLNTAKGHMQKYLLSEQVKPKKYFYALRPILACRWIEKYHTIPPILFDDLVQDLLPEEMKPHVATLLDLKINHPEETPILPLLPIQNYVEESIREIEAYIQTVQEEKRDISALNHFFLNEIGMERKGNE